MAEGTNNDIYSILESEILDLQLKPGQPLSENQLCARFNVSRTPIRSVLQRLQEKGLVSIVPCKATCVTQIDYAVVDQMIYQRLAVESMVLRDYLRVCGALDVEYAAQALNHLVAQYGEGNGSPNFKAAAFRQADMDMHEVWFKRMGKMRLWESIRLQESSYTRFCMLDILEADNYEYVLQEHAEMLRIIREKDETSIEPLLTKHFYGGMHRLGSKVFEEYKDYFIL